MALKGHGFSRAEVEVKLLSALAAEGWLLGWKTIPQGLKPRIPWAA